MMPRGFSAFRSCLFCEKPFKPEVRNSALQNQVCKTPACREKLGLYVELSQNKQKLLNFIKILEIKKNGRENS
jgi:hypothetical protein